MKPGFNAVESVGRVGSREVENIHHLFRRNLFLCELTFWDNAEFKWDPSSISNLQILNELDVWILSNVADLDTNIVRISQCDVQMLLKVILDGESSPIPQ